MTMASSEPSAPSGLSLETASWAGGTGGFLKSEIDQPIHQRFAKMVRIHPDRIAVRRDGNSWTYRELSRAAHGMAAALVSQNGDRSRPVGLVMEAGAPLFASMIGALQAGRFYVPLDPGLGKRGCARFSRNRKPTLS